MVMKYATASTANARQRRIGIAALGTVVAPGTTRVVPDVPVAWIWELMVFLSCASRPGGEARPLGLVVVRWR
jgi:hypothetical protein